MVQYGTGKLKMSAIMVSYIYEKIIIADGINNVQI
jgi:hypothetical protein